MEITLNMPDQTALQFERLKKTPDFNQKVLGVLQQLINEFQPEKKEAEILTRDPWEDLDFDKIAMDTGIEDLAINHDHYLYGTKKRTE